MSAYILWLMAGVLLLGAEALGASGIGLLFAGLAALCVGAWVQFAPDTSPLLQWIAFFAGTAVWAIILWKPLQKFRAPKQGYSNIIGDLAYIGAGGLQPGAIGEATWSGTIMKAQLAEGQQALAGGAAARITAVSGNTLILSSNA